MPPGPLSEQPQLADGLAFGLLALGAGLALVMLRRGHGDRRVVPIAGLLATAAGTLAIHRTLGLADGLALGLGLLAAAGATAGLARAGLAVVSAGLVFAIPGAWLLGRQLPPDSWAGPLVVLTAAVGGTLAAEADARLRELGLAPVLFGLSAVGLYFAVPDTEVPVLLMGAALPIVALGWPWPLASFGRGGTYAAVGLLAWAAAVGGRARPGSVVGGIACLGLLLTVPALALLTRDRRAAWPAAPLSTILLHLVLVLGAARLAAPRESGAEAAAVVAVLWALAAAVVAAWSREES